jgi:hypothetical protein
VRGKVVTYSSKDELEKLKKQRAELESKLTHAQRDRKALEEGMQILREKTAIRELEDKLKEEQDAVTSLRIETKELEDKTEVPNKLSILEVIKKPKAEMEDKKDTPETEKEEHSRIIWKRDDQTPISWKKDEQTPENTKPQEDESKESKEEQEKKKKRRFF